MPFLLSCCGIWDESWLWPRFPHMRIGACLTSQTYMCEVEETMVLTDQEEVLVLVESVSEAEASKAPVLPSVSVSPPSSVRSPVEHRLRSLAGLTVLPTLVHSCSWWQSHGVEVHFWDEEVEILEYLSYALGVSRHFSEDVWRWHVFFTWGTGELWGRYAGACVRSWLLRTERPFTSDMGEELVVTIS